MILYLMDEQLMESRGLRCNVTAYPEFYFETCFLTNLVRFRVDDVSTHVSFHLKLQLALAGS